MIKRYSKVDKGVYKEVVAYTVDEAKEKGIEWLGWKDREYSEYVESDNGYVVKCLGKKEYGKRKELYVRTEWGCMFHRQRFIVEPYRLTYSEWKLQRTIRRKKFKFVVDYVSSCMVYGTNIEPEVCMNILGIKSKHVKSIWKNMMENKEVQAMIQSSLQEKLYQMGVDEKKVIDLINDAVRMGKEKKNAFVVLKAAELMGKYLGMDSKTVIKESHSTDGDGNISRILKEISIEG